MNRQRVICADFRLQAIAALLLATALAGPAIAADMARETGTGRILTLQFENDFFGHADQHFTHGMRAAWMWGEDDVPQWVRDGASRMPLFQTDGSKRVVWSLGQSTFTPDDIRSPDVIEGERPYAGWLYVGVGLVSVSKDRMDNLELDIGMVGPASFAEHLQKTWHEWFGFQRPNGWRHQLKNEPGVVLTYERTWRNWAPFPFFGLGGELDPHLGASVGNVLTQAAAGFTVRIGGNTGRSYDYGPPRIRPSLPGSDFFRKGEPASWYLFFGAEGRAVARNIFLDGNSFADSHSVDKKPLVGDLQAGLALIIGRARLAYTHVWRTREYRTQDAMDQFGSISLSLSF